MIVLLLFLSHSQQRQTTEDAEDFRQFMTINSKSHNKVSVTLGHINDHEWTVSE